MHEITCLDGRIICRAARSGRTAASGRPEYKTRDRRRQSMLTIKRGKTHEKNTQSLINQCEQATNEREEMNGEDRAGGRAEGNADSRLLETRRSEHE